MYLKNRMLYTQLYSLPNEVLERIIIDSIVIEVLEQRLAKSAWNEKADAVLTRLSAVSTRFCQITTSSFFLKELFRTLNASG